MNKNESWNLVYSYSRAQAISDGVLVDVTEEAKAIGFKLHTVVTDHLFHGYVELPPGLDGEGQSVIGRLHDLMVLALFAVGDRPYGSTGCSANGATACSHNGAIW